MKDENKNRDIGTILRAASFAADKHRTQRRKDAAATPYVNHPLALATILASEGGITDPTVLAAALLHDTVEDTDTTIEEIEAGFGRSIAAIVAEVTDDKSLPKEERKRLQIVKAGSKSDGAKLVKLADKIANLRDIRSDPPSDWDTARRQEYFHWAARVVAGLRGISPALEAAFDEVFDAGPGKRDHSGETTEQAKRSEPEASLQPSIQGASASAVLPAPAEKVFQPLSMTDMARMINSANTHVTIAGPGIDDQIAGALVSAARRLPPGNVQVILDVAEENCRAGYGNVLGYTTLAEGNVTIRQCRGLRIGIIVCDNEGYVFATPPLLVEGPEVTANCPNAIRASRDQISAVLGATRKSPAKSAPKPSVDDQSAPVIGVEAQAIANQPEIGLTIVPKEEVQKLEQRIEQTPVQDLDLGRLVNVFRAHIQLGELTVKGAQLQNHTVRLPTSLLTIIKDDSTRRRVSAAFKMVSDKSAVSGAHIATKAANLRGRFFKHHPKYGGVFLAAKFKALESEVALLGIEIDRHKQKVRDRFAKEAEKSKTALVSAFWQAVQESPPDDLLAQLTSDKPSKDEAKSYLAHLLDAAFPPVDKLCEGMKIQLVPKDLTWETLNEPGFVDWLGKQYPANSGLKKPFEEFRAVRGRDGGPHIPEQRDLPL